MLILILFWGLMFVSISNTCTYQQEKTGQTSVPQIFFNETFVGGNDNLQKVLKNEEEWNKLLSDIQSNEPTEGTLLIPHPSEATDIAG